MKKSNENKKSLEKKIDSIIFDFIKDNAEIELKKQKEGSKENFLLSLKTQKELKDI
ncbi:hypothetical protein [Legionella pneumophila]